MTDRENPDPVGYRMPPRKHRFKKGQSGNPAGRPKKSQSKRAIVERVLGEKMRLSGRPKGMRVRFTWFELIVMKLLALVAGGSLPATKLHDELELKLGKPDSERIGVLIVPERLTEEEWEAMYTPKEPPVEEADDMDDTDGFVGIANVVSPPPVKRRTRIIWG